MAKQKPVSGWFLDTFRDHLLNEISGLQYEEPTDQRGLIYLAWGCQSPRYDHRSLSREGYKFLPHQVTARLFDRGRTRCRFNTINQRVGMFEVLSWNKHYGEARPYRPKPILRQAYLSYSATFPVVPDKPAQLIDVNTGCVVGTLRGNAVLSKDSNNRTAQMQAQDRAKINPYCPVNIPELQGAEMMLVELQHQVSQGRDNVFITEQLEFFGYDGTEHRDLGIWMDLRLVNLTHILHLANTAACPYGNIPSGYIEHQSGRLYAATYPHLQNVPRELKRVALAGCWEYDFANCHYSLFHQMAGEEGYEATNIQHYIDNKAEVRQQVAEDVGLTVNQVKEALLALIYGASTRKGEANPYFSKNTLLNICGWNKEKHLVLLNHPLFHGLSRDLEKGRDLITAAAPRSRGGIKNLMGKYTDRSNRKSQVLAHLLQGAEAWCLNTILRHYGEQIILLQHDGWNTTNRLDVGEMELVVARDTGFEIRIEEEHLPVDNLTQRWKAWMENDLESGIYKST